MLKKLFAAVIAATMVLGVVSFASAAAPSFPDTVGIPEETQIATLKALGIVTGDEQGRFNPNGTFTRAQMAVIAMKLMGYGDTAALMQRPTIFPDVQERHSWAWGFINVAVGQGIITGRPDGTFGPDDPATYTDVIVLLLRILNYEPILTTGTWPTKYLVKASQIGLTKGVSFRADAYATRRAVAVLAYNALTVPMVEQTKFGAEPVWEVKEDKTLLTLLCQEPVVGWLEKSPELFGAEEDEIVIRTSATATEELTLAEGVDVTGLLGHKVKAWLDKDGNVFLVQDQTPADSVKTASYVDADTVEIDDEEVPVTSTPKFLNYRGPQDYDLQDDGEITVIFDGDNPKYVLELRYTTGVVTGTSALYETITLTSGTLNLADQNVKWFGDADEIADLKKDDVVQYIKDDVDADGTDDHFVLIVTRNAPTGLFTRVKTDESITVGGVEYKRADDQTAAADQGLLGKNVKVLLNKDGKWWSIKALEAAAAPTTIGLVLDKFGDVMTPEGPQDYLYLLLADGTKRNFPCSQAAYDAVNQNDIVEYSLEDGVIEDAPALLVAAGAATAGLDVIEDYKLVEGKLVTDNTAIFKMVPGEDFKAATWDTIVAMQSGLQGVLLADGNKAKVIKITAGAPEVGEEQYGVYMGKYTAWDPVASKSYTYYQILQRDGVVHDYVYNSGPSLAKGDAVEFTVTGGKADFTAMPNVVPSPTAGYEWRVYSVEGNLLTLKEYNTSTGAEGSGEVSYLIIDETQFVDFTGTSPKHATGVNPGAKVRVHSTEDIEGTEVANIVVIIK